jgi:hypothetical protein
MGADSQRSRGLPQTAQKKFSLARNAKSGRAWKHFFRAQCIASIGETGEDVVVRCPAAGSRGKPQIEGLHGALTLWGEVDGSSTWPKKDRMGALAP